MSSLTIEPVNNSEIKLETEEVLISVIEGETSGDSEMTDTLEFDCDLQTVIELDSNLD